MGLKLVIEGMPKPEQVGGAVQEISDETLLKMVNIVAESLKYNVGDPIPFASIIEKAIEISEEDIRAGLKDGWIKP